MTMMIDQYHTKLTFHIMGPGHNTESGSPADMYVLPKKVGEPGSTWPSRKPYYVFSLYLCIPWDWAQYNKVELGNQLHSTGTVKNFFASKVSFVKKNQKNLACDLRGWKHCLSFVPNEAFDGNSDILPLVIFHWLIIPSRLYWPADIWYLVFDVW